MIDLCFNMPFKPKQKTYIVSDLCDPPIAPNAIAKYYRNKMTQACMKTEMQDPGPVVGFIDTSMNKKFVLV